MGSPYLIDCFFLLVYSMVLPLTPPPSPAFFCSIPQSFCLVFTCSVIITIAFMNSPNVVARKPFIFEADEAGIWALAIKELFANKSGQKLGRHCLLIRAS